MSIWGVAPEEVTIDLLYVAPDGTAHKFWIRVKKQLTIGEKRRIETAGWVSRTWHVVDGQPVPDIKIDWQLQTFARVAVWLLDWSLTGDDGKKLPPVREVIESLQPDVFALVEDGISAHIEAMALEKKATAGASERSRMSA